MSNEHFVGHLVFYISSIGEKNRNSGKTTHMESLTLVNVLPLVFLMRCRNQLLTLFQKFIFTKFNRAIRHIFAYFALSDLKSAICYK